MRSILAFVSALLFAASIAACGGSDNPTGTPTSTQVTGTARTVTATPTGGGQKTATSATPTPSVAATAPGATPSPPPVSSEGTPAVAPTDQAGFVAQFRGHQIDYKNCGPYDPTTGISNCNGVLYAVDPTIVGQDISCQLWIVDGTPRALACQVAEPQSVTYYEIQ